MFAPNNILTLTIATQLTLTLPLNPNLPNWIITSWEPVANTNFAVVVATALALFTEYIGPVPARYVRQSQMCPQLDMSDKNDQKTQDMSDKARCVRQKLQKIARYVRQMCQTKMKTKCKICLTGHNYNLQAFRIAFKPTYSNYTSILFNT